MAEGGPVRARRHGPTDDDAKVAAAKRLRLRVLQFQLMFNSRLSVEALA